MSTTLNNDALNTGESNINWMDRGWECPKCGAVMSPTTSCCVNCRGNQTLNVIDDNVQKSLQKLLNDWQYDLGSSDSTSAASEAYYEPYICHGKADIEQYKARAKASTAERHGYRND
jgi:hypothetical protein